MHSGDINFEQCAVRFREKRYLYLKNFLPKPVLDYLKVYYQILRANDYLYKDSACPLSLSIGGDPAFDAVLGWIGPEVSRLVGLDLAPTYSYTRIYAKGDILERHCDRDACEISATVSIEIPRGAGPSAIHLKPPNISETKIEMFEGDGCVYAGTEVEHWREAVTEDGYIQLFLFFIDKRGEHFPTWIYDKRKYLGAPHSQEPMEDGHDKECGTAKISEQKIAVSLLLKGGYQRCVELKVTDPSLISLLEVVTKRDDEKAKATVFNLELANGEGSILFVAADLIALSTNPAISIDHKIESSN